MAYRRLEERRERQTATWTGRRPSSSQWSCGSFSEVNGGERPMLNVAYCRVSTEEQAAEGFSIDGQAEKLHAYAELHDLGPVMLIEDPGRSGKNLERPGLQQLLAMVEQGRVTNVLVWRLDRLSRNLSDLILLADTFGKNDVGLHSFTEKIDLSSATGRMFYNILGAFAQFYREQLAENVRLGMQQAAREGRWVNRPKMGYDLVGGHLVLNGEAPTVRRVFDLRAEGLSFREIEERTGVKYSTVRAVLRSRIYLGEVLLNGEWYPGHHEPLVTPQEFSAAHRGHLPGRPRSRHLLSGRIRCGLCGRVASVRLRARRICPVSLPASGPWMQPALSLGYRLGTCSSAWSALAGRGRRASGGHPPPAGPSIPRGVGRSEAPTGRRRARRAGRPAPEAPGPLLRRDDRRRTFRRRRSESRTRSRHSVRIRSGPERKRSAGRSVAPLR
jgi:DNA invertase Pin-like site-specific DNA recombinase